MTRTVTKVDIKRAVSAVQDLGLTVYQVVVGAEGVRVITSLEVDRPAEPESDDDILQKYLASINANPAQGHP